MKVFTSVKSFKNIKKKIVLAIGVFDGLHKGHQLLLKKTVDVARKIRGLSAVLTFDVHPENYLNKQYRIKAIKDRESKINRLKRIGIDIVLIEKFGKIKSLTAYGFIKNYLLKNIKLHCVVTGRDFVFGSKKSGNVKFLEKAGKKFGFLIAVMPNVKINGIKISSTRIRKELKAGNIKLAEKMLGRKYSITGTVLHGRRIGFKYPTANIKLKYEDIPAGGVWAVQVLYNGKKYLGAANIGIAPTLKKEKKALLEVYIYNFHKIIYGKKLRIIFLEKIRDEKKFRSYDDLVKRVDEDIRFIEEKFRDR